MLRNAMPITCRKPPLKHRFVPQLDPVAHKPSLLLIGARRTKAKRMFWRLILPCALLAAASCRGSSDTAQSPDGVPALELTFLFTHKAGLEVGDTVTLRGFDIGRVHDVRLAKLVEVDVRIDASRRPAVLAASYGRINQSPITGSELEVVILDSESDPIEDHTRVPGATTKVEAIELEARYQAARAKNWLSDAESWLRSRL